MSQEELCINGELLRLRREARGWVLSDMATRACMSVKQIRQLEDGGVSAFYSLAVKATAAKKVGALLGVTSDEVFGLVQQVDEVELDSVEVDDAISVTQEVVEPAPIQTISQDATVQVGTDEPVQDSASPLEDKKSKTSFWVIAALFTAALGVAAYMQPSDEPIADTAPPLQVMPSEAVDGVSAADMSASAASSVVDSGVASVPQKSASVAASAPHAAMPTAVTPAASVASKAP